MGVQGMGEDIPNVTGGGSVADKDLGDPGCVSLRMAATFGILGVFWAAFEAWTFDSEVLHVYLVGFPALAAVALIVAASARDDGRARRGLTAGIVTLDVVAALTVLIAWPRPAALVPVLVAGAVTGWAGMAWGNEIEAGRSPRGQRRVKLMAVVLPVVGVIAGILGLLAT